MAALQTFRLFNNLLQPLVGASPTLPVYCNAAGTPVTPPAVFPLGLGKYGFIYDNPNSPRVYRVDGGASAVPRYLVGGNGGDVQAFGIYNALGVPTDPGSPPTFQQYVDQANAPITPPALVHPATGLYFFIPSPADIAAGRSFVIDIDASNVLLPDQYDGTVGNLPGSGGAGDPQVLNFDPALATAVRSNTPIVFDVVDAPVPLQRVVVLVSFPNLNLYEVAHDGEALGPFYRNTFCSRVAITNGFRYTLLRDLGWPSSPQVVPMAFDDGGGVNPINSVVYAWTLVE